MPSWLAFNLQDAASPLMEQLTFFHDYSMTFMILILSSLVYMAIFLLNNPLTFSLMNDNQFIETLWTSTPMIILIFLALPSIHILYIMDETYMTLLDFKIIGHQWYWSYEIQSKEFDSFILTDLNENSFRLLDVDNRLIIPVKTPINLIISSTDVIHSWTVPSLGVKVDAIPGRLNMALLMINRAGIFFGQCSEICGTNHSFMPIVIEATTLNKCLNFYTNLS